MTKYQTRRFFNYRTSLYCLLLALLPFLLFWQLWLPGGSGAVGFEFGDFVEQHHAMRTFVASELRQGRLPLWDPYTFAGQPALSDSLLATFYPPGLWQVLFDAPLPMRVLEVEAIAHLALAGIFTFLFLRRLTGQAGAALLGGIAFSLSGWATSYPMLQLIILECGVWLPAGLWMVERGLSRRSLATVGLAGVLYGISLLAGHPQTFLYIAYLTVVYFLFRAWRLRLGWGFTVLAALLLGLVILGVSAAQWLPSLQLYRASPRLGLDYAEVAHGFAPRELWGVLRPNPGQWSPLYAGVLPLGLALAALALQRRAEILFWWGVAIVALLLSLGGNGPLYPIVYRLAPGFGVFRDQERIAFLVAFALAVLASYGYAAVARRWRNASSWLPLFALLAFLDLFRANSGILLAPLPPGGYFRRTPLVDYLQRTGDPTWRLSSEGLLPGGANAGMVFRVRDVVGSGPLYVAALDQFIAELPEPRWWRLLNVQHLLTERQMEHGALLPVMEEDGRQLYQVFVGGTPAWIAHDYLIEADQAGAIRRAADPSLDPVATVVLEQAPLPAPAPASGDEAVSITTFEHHRLVAEVRLSSPGIVVFSEISYPGWTARVGDEELPGLRAYGLLRALALPAGEWRVEWRFQPAPVYGGILISAMTLLLVMALWYVERRAKKATG